MLHTKNHVYITSMHILTSFSHTICMLFKQALIHKNWISISKLRKTACTVHNQDHPVQNPNYITTISSRIAVLKTTQTQKLGPNQQQFLSKLFFNHPTTRANPHDHFMTLKQRLTRVGENPYLSKCRSIHCCNSSVC